MKKLRRALSVFLAIAVFFTQSTTMAYSEPMSDSEMTSQISETSAEPDKTEDEMSGSDETVKDDAYYENLRLSIEEKERAAIEADPYGMGFAIPLTEEEADYEQSLVEKDYAAAGLSTEVVVSRDALNCDYDTDYYYNRMSSTYKKIYNDLYSVVNSAMTSTANFTAGTLTQVNFSEDRSIVLTGDELHRLYRRFYFSNPQFFFIANGYSYTYQHGDQNQIIGIAVRVNTRYRPYSVRNQYKNNLNKITGQWLAEINSKDTLLEKQEAIYTKLCNKIVYTHRYNNDGSNCDQDMAAGVVDGACVCNGYALAAEYLCNASGINCITVTSETHAWNIVELYNNWYEMDVTWIDTSGGNLKWLNKSHDTIMTQDGEDGKISHDYETDIWGSDIPVTEYDTVKINGIASIAVKTAPTNLTYIYGSNFDLTGGVIEVRNNDGSTDNIDMAEALDEGKLTVSGYSPTKLGSQTLTLRYAGKSVTLAVKVIVDPDNPPVTMTVGDETTNYLDVQTALGAITAEGDYTIAVKHNSQASSITVPAKATSVTITTAENVCLKTNSIAANADLVIDGDIQPYTASYGGADLTIASDVTVTVKHGNTFRNIKAATRAVNSVFTVDTNGESCIVSGTVSGITSVNVNAAAELSVSKNISGVSEINNHGVFDAFGNITGVTTINNDYIKFFAHGNVSVTNLNGYLDITNPASTATITNITGSSDIRLYSEETGGTLDFAKLTVTNLPSDSTLKVTAVEDDGTALNILSGTTLFLTAASSVADQEYIKTQNKSGDKQLSMFKYGSQMRAENADMLTFSVADGEGIPCPNFEQAFLRVEKGRKNTIILNEDADLGKLALPSDLGTGSLVIKGADPDGYKKLILHNITTLSPKYNLILQNIELVPLNSKGNAQVAAFTINGSKGVELSKVKCDEDKTTINVTVGSDSELKLAGNRVEFGNLTGKTSSVLYVSGGSEKAVKVTTFGNVLLGSEFTVNTTMSGVTSLSTTGASASLVLSSSAAATITTLGKDSSGSAVTLLADGAKFPNLTVTNIVNHAAITVKAKDAPDGEAIALASGTKIFTMNCTQAAFDEKNYGGKTGLISISNKTAANSTGNALSAFYYNKEIRAEYADALTLKVGSAEPQSWPSFEQAFARTEKDKTNIITVKADIDATKFILPSNLGSGSLVIRGASGQKKITIHNIISIAPAYEFEMKNIALSSIDNNGSPVKSLTINSGKNILLSDVFTSPAASVNMSGNAVLTITGSTDMVFNTLKGATKSGLIAADGSGNITADVINGFGTVTTGLPIYVVNRLDKISSVEGSGTIILTKPSTIAAITNINDSLSICLAQENGIVSKLTVTNISEGSLLEIYTDGTFISGTKVMYMGSNTDISGRVSIRTKDPNGRNLIPVAYKKEIRAEIPDVIGITVNGETAGSFTSFEKLFDYIATVSKNDRTNQNIYTVTIDADIETNVFTLPKYGAGFTVKSTAGNKYKLTLRGVTISPKAYRVGFENVDISFVS